MDSRHGQRSYDFQGQGRQSADVIWFGHYYCWHSHFLIMVGYAKRNLVSRQALSDSSFYSHRAYSTLFLYSKKIDSESLLIV